jgi:hypothetical protein
MFNFENIYNIIKELHPLYHEKHKKWFKESYDICNTMLLKYNDEISELFVIQYFINKFQEEHTNIRIYLPDDFKLKHANIFAYFNGDILYVTQSNDNRIKIGSSITMINNKPFKNYINEFMLYNGGICDDYMDMKYQSNFIFIDYKNKFFEKPYIIKLDNKKEIDLKYNKFYSDVNVLDFFTYDIIDQRYSINKKVNHIYMHINDFDKILYNDLVDLLPCDELTVDLKNNFGGSVYNVEKFFKIVYNIDIQLGIHIKLNRYINNDDVLKIKVNELNKSLYCRETIIKKYINKVIGPKLNVYVNEYSRSASKAFVNIVKTLIPNHKIYGVINTDDLCGTSITITTPYYDLNVPTMCYSLNGCEKKKIDLEFNKL